MNRRRFLQEMLAAATVGSSVLAEPAPFALVLGETPPYPPMPHDFIGLSYEAMQLEDPAFFSVKNRSLVEQFRMISSRGVLRLGGNTSEFSWWKERNSDAANLVSEAAKPAHRKTFIAISKTGGLDRIIVLSGCQ